MAVGALKEPAEEIGSGLATLLNLLFTPLQMAQSCRDAWLEDFEARVFVSLFCRCAAFCAVSA